MRGCSDRHVIDKQLIGSCRIAERGKDGQREIVQNIIKYAASRIMIELVDYRNFLDFNDGVECRARDVEGHMVK
jgi:hypothetical protein